ncbi:hypothetical protein RBH89_20225 [Paracidovorax avenae]
MDWVLAIMAFPYAAVALFLVFGSCKLVRPQRRATHMPAAGPASLVAVPPPQALPAPSPPPGPAWATQQLAGLELAPPVRNARIAFLGQGAQALEALLATVDSAQNSLDVCTFVFGNDELGRRLAAALHWAWTTPRSTALMRSAGHGPSCYSARSASNRQHIASPRKIASIAQFLSNWHSRALCQRLTFPYKSTTYSASCGTGEYKTQ